MQQNFFYVYEFDVKVFEYWHTQKDIHTHTILPHMHQHTQLDTYIHISKLILLQYMKKSNLSTAKFVQTGEAVGVLAAQSIGEPGSHGRHAETWYAALHEQLAGMMIELVGVHGSHHQQLHSRTAQRRRARFYRRNSWRHAVRGPSVMGCKGLERLHNQRPKPATFD